MTLSYEWGFTAKYKQTVDKMFHQAGMIFPKFP